VTQVLHTPLRITATEICGPSVSAASDLARRVLSTGDPGRGRYFGHAPGDVHRSHPERAALRCVA